MTRCTSKTSAELSTTDIIKSSRHGHGHGQRHRHRCYRPLFVSPSRSSSHLRPLQTFIPFTLPTPWTDAPKPQNTMPFAAATFPITISACTCAWLQCAATRHRKGSGPVYEPAFATPPCHWSVVASNHPMLPILGAPPCWITFFFFTILVIHCCLFPLWHIIPFFFFFNLHVLLQVSSLTAAH